MWPYHPDPRYNFPDLPLMEDETILNQAILPKDQVYLTTWYTERTVLYRKKQGSSVLYLPAVCDAACTPVCVG